MAIELGVCLVEGWKIVELTEVAVLNDAKFVVVVPRVWAELRLELLWMA